MVALVIVGGAGMALFSWIDSSVMALRRVEAANERSAATANVLEFMELVNPMIDGRGSFDFGSYAIQWEAKPLTATQEGSDFHIGQSNFQLALYSNHVVVQRKDGAAWFDLTLKQTGYRKVRADVNLLQP